MKNKNIINKVDSNGNKVEKKPNKFIQWLYRPLEKKKRDTFIKIVLFSFIIISAIGCTVAHWGFTLGLIAIGLILIWVIKCPIKEENKNVQVRSNNGKKKEFYKKRK